MSVSRGFKGNFGYVGSGLMGVHRDPTKWVALKEPPTITPEIAQIDSRVFTAGAHHLSMERLQGTFNYTGSFVMVMHPEEGVEFFRGVFPTVTSTELTGAGSGIYEHEFLGADTVPMAQGFSVTVDEDISVKYISGLIVTSIEIGAEIDGEVLATVNWVAKKVETADAGTSGTSQGENAVSFTATITEDSNDDFKLAIDGDTAYECTIAAGEYTSATTLQAAINAAILAQTSLQDSDGEPEVACYINSDSKVVFYTADKGTDAEVTWTAGSNDANTTLGYGTPTESAGTAALATASYSSVQPFCATQLTVKQDSTEIYLTAFKAMFDTHIVPRKCTGSKFMKEGKLSGKRDVTLTLTKDYEDDNAFDAWEGNSDVQFEVNLRTGTAIVALSGVNYDADMYFLLCRINNTPEPSFNGQDSLTQEIGATSMYYDATYQDGKLDINNTMATIPVAGNV